MNKRASCWDDYKELDWLSDGEYNEKASLLVFTRSRYGDDGYKHGQIILRNTETETETVITAGGTGEGSPAIRSDGKCVAFLSSTDAGSQIWLYDTASEQVRRLTQLTYAPMEPRWSPDGKYLAVLVSIPQGEQLAYDPLAPVVMEDFGYKFDGVGYAKATVHTHLWCVDATNGEAVALTEGDSDDMLQNWSPDSQYLVFASNRAQGEAGTLGQDLFVVSRTGSGLRQLSKDNWVAGYPVPFRPMYTPDGKYVVGGFLEMANLGEEDGYPPTKLYCYQVDSGAARCLIPPDNDIEVVPFPYNTPMARCRDRAAITSDGQRVIFLSSRNGGNHLYSAAIYGEPDVQPVCVGEQCFIGVASPHNGKLLVAVGDLKDPGSLRIISDKTGQTLQTHVKAGQLIEQTAVSVPETMWIKTLDGESTVQGWVLPPQNCEKGRTYPAIVYIHGGPNPFYSYCLDYELQCLAGAGFAVIYLNPRGSSGYGRKHQNIERAFDGAAYTDILQFVDEACKKYSFIDPDRIGATGGSYGGYMTNYLATHCKRFGAYVTQRSVVNKLIDYGCGDMHLPAPADVPFLSVMLDKLKESAIVSAQNVDKPFLILHGTEDYRCPVEGAHQMFVALKDCHPQLPVRMILFPHTNHQIPVYLPQKLLYHREMTAWFTKYLVEA